MPTPTEIRDAFKAFDKNKDGVISRDEMIEFLTRGSGMPAAEAGAKFDEVDKNGDGSLSIEEFVSAWATVKEAAPIYLHLELAKQLFETIDANLSGSVDATELQKGLGNVDGSAQMFAWFDSIGKADGVITVVEFIPGIMAMYQGCTPDEITAKLKERIAKSRSIMAASAMAYGS